MTEFNVTFEDTRPISVVLSGSNSPVPVNFGEVQVVNTGGTYDHRILEHRNAEDQHPISAITNLAEELPDVLTNIDILEILGS